jgi:hypothetical protein
LAEVGTPAESRTEHQESRTLGLPVQMFCENNAIVGISPCKSRSFQSSR